MLFNQTSFLRILYIEFIKQYVSVYNEKKVRGVGAWGGGGGGGGGKTPAPLKEIFLPLSK